MAIANFAWYGTSETSPITIINASVGINAAISALTVTGEGGTVIILPAGAGATYELQTPIVIDGDNITIECRHGVIFAQSSTWAGTELVDFGGFKNCAWRGGKFVFPAGYDSTATHVIENVATTTDSNQSFTVEGVTFDLTAAGLNELNSVDMIHVEGLPPDPDPGPPPDALRETRGVRVLNNNFMLTPNNASSGVTCVYLEECVMSYVEGNLFGTVATGVVQAYERGIHVNGGRFNTIRGNTFLNVWGKTATPDSITAHIYLEGSTATASGTGSFEAGHTNITGNTFESSDATTGIQYAILLEGPDFVNVCGNNFGRQTDSLATIKATVKSSTGGLGRGLLIANNQFHAQITNAESTPGYPIHIDGYARVNVQGNLCANWNAITQDFMRVDAPATMVTYNDNTNSVMPGSNNPQNHPSTNRQRSPINFRGPRNQEWVDNAYPGTRNY